MISCMLDERGLRSKQLRHWMFVQFLSVVWRVLGANATEWRVVLVAIIPENLDTSSELPPNFLLILSVPTNNKHHKGSSKQHGQYFVFAAETSSFRVSIIYQKAGWAKLTIAGMVTYELTLSADVCPESEKENPCHSEWHAIPFGILEPRRCPSQVPRSQTV